MAYKDEYEVARLHADPAFLQRLKETFEGDFSVHFHLAPPLLPLGKDARGRPNKRQFGPWMGRAFHMLARLKSLRGTPFDPFGYTAERREERALIAWYEDLVAGNLAGIDFATAEDWKKRFEAPMQMRGYGPVKAEAVARIKAEIEEGLAA